MTCVNEKEKRKKIYLKFLYKIVNRIINCPKLLSCFNFIVPHKFYYKLFLGLFRLIK